MENRKLIGGAITALLGLALVLTIVWSVGSAGTQATGAASGMSMDGFSSQEEMMAAHHPDQAGAATGAAASGGMSSDGFSSYEEMMAAHHPSGGAASSEDGCGGVAGASAATASFAGQQSDYGITYDDAGYQQLLGFAKSLKVDKATAAKFVGLNIQLPCCGVRDLQASDNCECGHHVAMFGLAKLLASKGYDRETIQVELDKWKLVFYPDASGGSTGAC